MDAGNMVKINETTTMIDIELFGIKRVGALFLLRGGRSCLVDSGTKKEARSVVKALDLIGAFPPDMIVLTHSHWDHSQGVPTLCKAAAKRGKNIVVKASEKAIANLEDQSWNTVFDDKQTFDNIYNVEPLKDGEILDLDGLELEIMDFSGHCADDIALYDRAGKTIFVGDATGYKVENVLAFPPFMPPFWNADGFYSAVRSLKQVDYDRLCLAHFGCLEGEAAKKYPDEAVKTLEAWWDIFVEADGEGKLEDVHYLKRTLLEKMAIDLPDLEVSKASMRWMLATINSVKKMLGKKPIQVADLQMEGIVGWLTKGYRTYASRS